MLSYRWRAPWLNACMLCSCLLSDFAHVPFSLRDLHVCEGVLHDPPGIGWLTMLDGSYLLVLRILSVHFWKHIYILFTAETSSWGVGDDGLVFCPLDVWTVFVCRGAPYPLAMTGKGRNRVGSLG